MRSKRLILVFALVALVVGYVVPHPVSAQGMDAVFKSLRLATPLARQYMEPQGLQDSAGDLLTADMNVMSSTYQTVMSASVTVGEAGDAVSVHVTGQFGVMLSLYVADDSGNDELWRIDDPTAPDGAADVGDFANGLGNPQGITSHGGSLYVVNSPSGNTELWRIDDSTAPSGAVNVGDFPSGLSSISGITSHGGSLYVVGTSSNFARHLWRIDDPTAPGGAISEGQVSSNFNYNIAGITSHGGSLYVVMGSGSTYYLWRIDDSTTPSGAVNVGSFPSGLTAPRGITSHGGSLYFVNDSTTNRLWRLDNVALPSGAVSVGSFPSGLTAPRGITSHEHMVPCMVRLARGTTEIKVVSFDEGRILFDTTFSDAPGVGTHTYALQVRTEQAGGCTAYRGDGSVPMPSLYVQSYYAGSIP